MNCWHCNTELIWGADADIEEDFQPVLYQEYSMVSNFSWYHKLWGRKMAAPSYIYSVSQIQGLAVLGFSFPERLHNAW